MQANCLSAQPERFQNHMVAFCFMHTWGLPCGNASVQHRRVSQVCAACMVMLSVKGIRQSASTGDSPQYGASQTGATGFHCSSMPSIRYHESNLILFMWHWKVTDHM